MKLSITVTSDFDRLYGHDFHRILDVARWAEAAGVHQLDIAEHLCMGDGSSYPFGDYPASLEEPWPEPIATLSAIAAVTEKMRLGTGILIAPLRPPALLAKQLATVDRISQGRLDIGIASGWQREEYEACGIPFAHRNQRMDDTVRACRALWTGERVSVSLDTIEFREVLAVPTPVQKELPIWYGGSPSEVTAARIAEFGQGWIPLFLPEDQLKHGIELIRQAFRTRGREPQSLQVRHYLLPIFDESGVLDIEAMFGAIPRLRDMGVTMISLGLGWCIPSADQVESSLHRVGECFSKWTA